jgi:hypothetical protein
LRIDAVRRMPQSYQDFIWLPWSDNRFQASLAVTKTSRGRLCGIRRQNLCEVDFIQRYVFPGGMLPSPQVLKSLGERFGVPVIRERIFGQDYAKTLAAWWNNFRAAWPNLMPLAFDHRFRSRNDGTPVLPNPISRRWLVRPAGVH